MIDIRDLGVPARFFVGGHPAKLRVDSQARAATGTLHGEIATLILHDLPAFRIKPFVFYPIPDSSPRLSSSSSPFVTRSFQLLRPPRNHRPPEPELKGTS